MAKSSESDAGEIKEEKSRSLKPCTEHGEDQAMTTNQGVRINDDQNQLKAGGRGPSLLEDFIFRESVIVTTDEAHQKVVDAFIDAIAMHRHWERENSK